MMLRTLAGAGLLATLAWGAAVRAQEQQPPPAQKATVPGALQEEAQKNPIAPCIQPAPLAQWQDYEGPFQKTVAVFARRLERKSVHPPHYKPGAVLCTLETKDKFILFLQDTVDPLAFLNAGFNAGIDQAENVDPTFGQGAEGYGKRFGANYADQASSEFFKDFLYPSIFSEDPRYYRLAHGPVRKRFLHALGHPFFAHRPDGSRMFNYSEWLGTTTAVVLSNTYHPGNDRGVGSAAQRVAYGVGMDMGFDTLREFWPEIAHKFRLPFRDPHEPPQK